jgi:ferritin
MNKNRLSPDMEAGLNKQLTQEAWASQVYLSYASWAAGQGYNGIANFLFRHANEERNHMMKFLEYILERGGKVVIDAIPKPPQDPTSIQNCFDQVFQQEVDNTTGIYRLVKLSHDQGDWATWHFMQWFVMEQTEEETLALNLLDKIKIAGGEQATAEALYNLDRDMGNEPDEAELAENKTTDNP